MNTRSPNTYQVFKNYDQQFERQKTDILFLPSIFAKIINQVQGNILDIGTGDGHKLETILRAVPKQKIKEVIALEPSPLAKQAIERLKDYSVQIQDLAIEDLKGYNDYFNSILMFEVLEHLPDQRIILNQILKLLHPDGILIISTPNRPIYNFTERIAGRGLDPTHCSALNYRQLKNLIKDYFRKVEYFGVVPLAMKLTRLLGLTKGTVFPNLPIFSADIFCFAREPLKSDWSG
jgi:2-polyprenyl-3-methyl-5-hydroxy-6-metoxy-1,4-benzoquinol methylase